MDITSIIGANGEVIYVNDKCRLCNENLRINGNLCSCRRIFHKDSHEKTVYERLKELGLQLSNTQERSYRACLKCVRLIGRLEITLGTFKRWQEAEQKPSSEQPVSTVSGPASVTHRQDWVQTPKELPTHPPAPTAPPAPNISWPTTENAKDSGRNSVTEVVVYYPSRPKGDRIICQDDVASMVEALARDNWTWAAKQITKHKELRGPLTENILRIIEEECKKICSPFADFMLFKSSAEDLKSFSLEKLQADLQRVSPFLFSIFLCVSKQSSNTACAAAAIALRGRETRLSAFSYYVNSLLQRAGIKKAAFKSLSKLGITTSYEKAVIKQKEMAKTCVEDFEVVRVTDEMLLKEEHEDSSAASEEPEEAMCDLDGAMLGLTQTVFSAGVPSLSPGPGLTPDPEKPPQIKEEPEEPSIKQEEEQLPVCVPEFTTVCVKTEESELKEETQREDIGLKTDGQSEQSDTDNDDDWDAPMETETDGQSEQSSDTDDDDDWDPPMETKADGDESRVQTRRTAEQNSDLSFKSECPAESSTPDQENKYQCPFCQKTHLTKRGLQRHVRVHTGERPYSCSVCKKTFTFNRSLQKHERKHTTEGASAAAERKHQCSVCHKKFGTKQDLQKHSRVHTGEKPYNCSLCSKTFAYKTNLDSHMRTHTGEKPYTCSICEKTFSQKGNLQTHMRTHVAEGSSVDNGDADGAEAKKHQCNVCEKRFWTKQDLERHNLVHTGQKPYSCSVCHKAFVQKGYLQTHMRKHSGVSVTKQVEDPQDCPVCQRTYRSKQSLQKHMMVHAVIKPYSCTVCGKAFCLKSKMKSHMRVHTGEKPFHCSICSKSFSFSSNLASHMRTHTGEKPYRCSVCHKEFSSVSSLKVHKRMHTGEKPYSCPLCPKTFTQKGQLDSHMKTHTGERPYGCPLCTKAFKQTCHLNEHLKTHRDASFNCSICQSDFSDSTALRKHLKTHTEEKPSSCSSPQLLERTIAESEVERCSSKEEKNQRKPQLLDSALIDLQLRDGVPSLSLKQDVPEPPQIKEEEEEERVKQEEEQLPVSAPTL